MSEDVVRSLINMCLKDVLSLILNKPHTIKYRGLITKSSHLTPKVLCDHIVVVSSSL